MLEILAMVLLQTSAQDYARSREALEAARRALAPGQQRSRAAARAALTRWLEEDAFPAWAGTEWAFYGVSQTPGRR
jgi:hypothetical protein